MKKQTSSSACSDSGMGTMTISLTGFMGCGKSSTGRELAVLLGCPFVDLDSAIEEKTGRSIPEIFRESGEGCFRKIEHDTLLEILSSPEYAGGEDTGIKVISLGGGTLMTPECARLVKERTLCIYLRAATETLVGNLENDFTGRPMLDTGGLPGVSGLKRRIEELMASRAGVYESTASRIIDIEGKNFSDIAREIASLIKVF